MKTYDIVSRVTVYAWEELPEADRTLVEMARQATNRSYAPYSKFQVGAAVLTDAGHTIVGANQENPATPSSLCAERVALFAANAQYPDEAPVTLALAAQTGGAFTSEPIVPCGACRQVISGIRQRYGHPIRILLYGTDGTHVVDDIDALLPMQFEL